MFDADLLQHQIHLSRLDRFIASQACLRLLFERSFKHSHFFARESGSQGGKS
uniref:Uncharacterized protein n=1 Tax=uncultured Armatimonadetes bacterium TaxID=157466 RepID=A0A6J4IDW0_9BACT|nr:hypothetical protein AVDCRST_MAG63-1740 [uncultured Armatimonadetes bacterium]